MSLVEQIAEMMSTILQLCANEDYPAINDLLKSFDISNESSYLLHACCRLTFPVREHLPYWDTFLKAVCNEFQKRGDDALFPRIFALLHAGN